MRLKIYCLTTAVLLLTGVHSVIAQTMESNYFSIDVQEAIDIHRVYTAIDLDDDRHLDILLTQKSLLPEDRLKKVFDTVYMEVSDILDIHMHTVRFNVRVFTSKSELKHYVKENFNRKLHSGGLYLHEKNTIYLSAEDLNIGLFGHEVAHAIVSHYFVVPPPEKVQEVLCGYVEYKLKKKN